MSANPEPQEPVRPDVLCPNVATVGGSQSSGLRRHGDGEVVDRSSGDAEVTGDGEQVRPEEQTGGHGSGESGDVDEDAESPEINVRRAPRGPTKEE